MLLVSVSAAEDGAGDERDFELLSLLDFAEVPCFAGFGSVRGKIYGVLRRF